MSEAPTPIPSALDLLTQVQSRPVCDGASISPEGAQFPLVHVDWHEGHGFVLQCYEDEESWSDFLVTSQNFSAPSNRSGAWRAGAGTMAARVVRFGGADHPGPQSFFEVRQARPGPQVGQNRYFSTRNRVGRSGRKRRLGTRESGKERRCRAIMLVGDGDGRSS